VRLLRLVRLTARRPRASSTLQSVRIAGLSGYDSAEARTVDVPRRIAVFTAAEVIQVGRARGYEVEPIYSITAQRFVDATQGKGLAEVDRTVPPGSTIGAGAAISLSSSMALP